jgi:hypothetical protein
MPSGRLTVQQARTLRWVCLIPCLVYSVCFSTAVMQASAAISFFFYAYNELGFDYHWVWSGYSKRRGSGMLRNRGTLIAGENISGMLQKVLP